jgi:hypothetical protein
LRRAAAYRAVAAARTLSAVDGKRTCRDLTGSVATVVRDADPVLGDKALILGLLGKHVTFFTERIKGSTIATFLYF